MIQAGGPENVYIVVKNTGHYDPLQLLDFKDQICNVISEIRQMSPNGILRNGLK